ncbi:hypothetical protein [Kitasatospora sp. NPDC002040]|uniref:hypothetical protein n=1 Tax=Kitasatospora sp. NPDC002040 TaxID=3154661 RepID=UPI003334743A
MTSAASTVRTGELPGSARRPTEDVVLTLPDAVVVLDGVSTVTGETPYGGWYARELGGRIAGLLTEGPAVPLRDVITAAIAGLVREHDIAEGSAAATVAVARLDRSAGLVEAAVLGDSPVVALLRDGGVRELRDDRLAELIDARPQAAEYRARLRAGHGFDDRHGEILRELREYQHTVVNRPGGYWIAATDPTAGQHAVTAGWPAEEIGELLLATDGVSSAVDDYGLLTWPRIAATCRSGHPQQVLEAIEAFEQQDPDARHAPRGKLSDDKALAYWPMNAV